jgi:hypothetical protein
MTTDAAEPLYAINDALSALAHNLGAPFTSEDDEDYTLNELTHEVARAFRAGPYRYATNATYRAGPTPRERAAALLTDTDIAGLLAGADR